MTIKDKFKNITIFSAISIVAAVVILCFVIASMIYFKKIQTNGGGSGVTEAQAESMFQFGWVSIIFAVFVFAFLGGTISQSH